MAVTKIWQVKGSLADVVKYAGNPEKTRTHDLARVVGYAADEHKTLDENEQFYAVTGVNCNAKTALDEMLAVRNGSAKPAAMWLTTRTKASKPERLRRSNVTGSALSLSKRCGATDIRCWLRPILTRERCTTILFFSRCVCGTAKNMTAISASITACASCPMRCAAAKG